MICYTKGFTRIGKIITPACRQTGSTITNIKSLHMKINWGTAIVIAFVLFISFILYFVIKVQTQSQYDNDLVVEEYYKNDAKFGEQMIRVQNANELVEKPTFDLNSKGITIHFPKSFEPINIKGNILMYRPSNKKFDFNTPLKLQSDSLIIPQNKLVSGRWNIEMEWQYQGKKYLTKEKIYIN